MLLSNPLFVLLLLLGASTLTGILAALQRMGKLRTREEFQKKRTLYVFYHYLNLLFGEKKWQGLFFTLTFTKVVLQLAYGITAFFLLIEQHPFAQALQSLQPRHLNWDVLWLGAIIIAIIACSLLADFLMTLFALSRPTLFFKIFSPFASLFLLVCSPFTALFLKLLQFCLPRKKAEKSETEPFELKDKVLDLLSESELAPYLDPSDLKLIASMVSFKERIAREVMVPRIDIFSLPSDTAIEEAAQSFLKEGYSRIPVYRDSVDHIIGVLNYKDVLKIYASQKSGHAETLKAPIEHLVKPVLYAPETKKISVLLQEFRSKQIHIAIVVDEYGGTEGIVTIEDILEELVGEIADEYDSAEELLYSVLPSGGWIVDAKMSIIDIEEELGIKVPQSPEYDTLGGYIFHRAGAIPSKGWRLHHDECDLEVISSNERSIEKIRITPHEKRDLT